MNLEQLKRLRRTLKANEATAAQAVVTAERAIANELFNVHECQRALEGARDRTTYEAASAALEHARVDHVLATKNLSDAQGAQAHAELAARAAESQVISAIEEIFRAEDVEAALVIPIISPRPRAWAKRY